MNLIKIDDQIKDFSDRIIKTLKLQYHRDGILAQQKRLCTWIREQAIRVRKEKEERERKEAKVGYVGGFVKKIFRKEAQVEKDPIEKQLNLLTDYVKKGLIPKSFSFSSKSIPESIKQLVQGLKGKKWKKYYGFVKGPFLSDFFILGKEDFHSAVEAVEINKLKFLMIEQKVAHKYQRNLVQQIFGRIFRQKGSLSLVLKIEVNFDPLQPPYNLFCYIEDIKLQHEIQWRPLSDLTKDGIKLYIKQKGKVLQVSEVSMLQIFLSEILVLPLQSLVSDYIVQIPGKSVEMSQKPPTSSLVKYNKQTQQQIIKQKNLKQHPCLRNPLTYFRSYLHEHSIKISQVHKITINRELYASFYKCLEIVINLMLTDFDTEADDVVISSSVCFTGEVFLALWVTFHKINLLEGWMREVIEPLKDSITISEIVTHFCPIFNEISVYDAVSFEAYREFFINLEMQNYLATIVTKTSLQKYKDMYVSASQTVPSTRYTSISQIYDTIFRPILHEVNLLYCDPIQAAYILNFCCKYYFKYKPLPYEIEEKWKNRTIWEKCVRVLKEERENGDGVSFVDIGFDFMGYACGIDMYGIDSRAFERVGNMGESMACIQGVVNFVNFVRKNFEKVSAEILSGLLQKAFKHKKFKICQALLEKKVQIRDFKQILKSSPQLDTITLQTKSHILHAIQQESPQMHRLYQWQQLMLVHLKEKKEDSIEINTIEFGKCYLPATWMQKFVSDGKVVNNLSRKDSRFSSGKEIAYFCGSGSDEGINFYIGAHQFPLMPYFYKIFLQKLDSSQLSFNFASFFHGNKMYYLSQHLPQLLSYKKGLLTYTEQQLSSMTELKLISQSIILTMILLPSEIGLEDIYISPFGESEGKGEIFVVDFWGFYQKNFMCRFGGKTMLNCKNSLFLLEIMNKAVHPSVVKKYADMDVMQLCETIFLECKKFTQDIHKTYKLQKQTNINSKQLLATIFQPGFIINLAQRMFKIKRLFIKNIHGQSRYISHYQILESLHSQTSYYYQEVFNTSVYLRERELALRDQNWRRSFLHANIIEFFGSFRMIEEVQMLFPNYYYKFCFQGPSQSLAQFTINLKKFKAFSDEIPQNLSDYSNQFFEYIIKNIDLTHHPQPSRHTFIETIKNKSIEYLEFPHKKVLPLSFISIKSVEQLKQTYLDKFSFERVHELIIEACRLRAIDVRSVPQSFGNVIYLHLRDIRGLRYIGENTISGQPMQIKHLKTLSIMDCPSLISMDLKCAVLECLQLRNNESLETAFIYSLNLKNIYIYNNPSINFENIGIYIIKGVNVLMCRSSCRGDISRLYTKDYQGYVKGVLRGLLECFYIKEYRYVMLLTLCKMKEVSQQLFARAGISSFKSFQALFSQFTVDIQDNLLSQIFRLYFQNPYLSEITIGKFMIELSEAVKLITIPRMFKVASSGLSKIGGHKMFKSLRFQCSSVFFEKLEKMQVKTLVDLIKAEKFFTLSFANLDTHTDVENSISIDKQIQLIRYLALQKDDIQKITLSLTQSHISLSFLSRIFQATLTLQQMKQQQQQFSRKGLRTQISRLMSKRSVNEEYPRHMKINRIVMDQCQFEGKPDEEQQEEERKMETVEIVIRDQPSGLIQIDESCEQNLPPQFSKPVSNYYQIQSPIQSPLKNHENQFNSVKQLHLKRCQLQSFSLLKSVPNLTTLTISECNLKAGIYENLLPILLKSLRFLKTLSLEAFFKGDSESEKTFTNFCEVIKKMPGLTILKLNNSFLTFDSLLKLDRVINNTSIQQLQLDGLNLHEKQLQHKISYLQEKIQKISQMREKKQEKNSAYLRNFLSNTTTLKTLTIFLSAPSYIQQFILALTKNKSLLQVKLHTNYEIPSSVLTPLSQNTTISSMTSNMQLPIWLLNHFASNRNTRKEAAKGFNSDLGEDSVINEFIGLNNSRVNDCYKLGLSLDGGGMRGMLLATELEYLTKGVGYPLHKIFDCIGGTSIGGILALLSAGTLDGVNPVIPNEDLCQLFTKFGQDIFKKSQFRHIKSLFESKYPPESYEEVLKNYFKDCRLSNCLQDTNVIVTAVNRMDNKDYVFRSMEALLNREKDFFMRDVARATSAAPTYFPSAEIKNVNASLKLSLIDGGLGMNNPSKLVIDQVKKISANSGSPQNYFLLSLGTGRLPSQNIPQSAGLKDISPIIDTYAESSNYFLQRDLSINYKGHFYRVSPSIIMPDKSDAELDNTDADVIEVYRKTGLEASKKYFNNTVIFGKYRNMNLIEWLKQNTEKKYES